MSRSWGVLCHVDMDELVLSPVYFIDPLETLVEYIGSPAAGLDTWMKKIEAQDLVV